MRWSDGEYLSTYHRVRAPTKDNGIPLVSSQLLLVGLCSADMCLHMLIAQCELL